MTIARLANGQPAPRLAQRSQQQFPAVPPEVADIQCERCTRVWKDGKLTLKFLSRACAVHAQYLEAP